MINFPLIKMQHAHWNVQLSHLLIEENDFLSMRLDNMMFDHRNCDLGKWLYSQGLVKLGGLVAVQTLERVHKQLHTLGRQIFDAKKAGNISEAEELLVELQLVNHQLVSLIDTVENNTKAVPVKV